VTEEDLRRASDALVYSPKHKLVLCVLPKTASTEWRRFILRLNGVKGEVENPFEQ